MKDFSVGSIPRHLIAFSVPMIISSLVQSAYAVIDAIWVGRLIGHQALAAVSTTMPVIFFSASLIIGTGIASAILTGQSYGAKNFDRLKLVVVNSLIISLILSVVVTIGALLLARPILLLINTPLAILDTATTFLQISILGFTGVSIIQWFSMLLNGLGNARTPLFMQMATIGLNIVLAPILILGIGTGKPMGVAGSAIATVIANVFGVILVIILYRRNVFLKKLGFVWKIDPVLFRKIFFMGIPMSLQMIVVSASFLVITSLVNKFGETTTAAFGIGSRIDQFAFMTIIAVSGAISSMTAQNIGAGKSERIPLIVKWGIMVSLGFALFFLVLAFGFARPIAGIFTNDALVIQKTIEYFRIVCFAYLGFAVLFSFQGVVRGAGDVVSSLVIVASAMMFFRIPLCYFLAEKTPLRENGLWLGMTISIILGAIIFWIYYLSVRWKLAAAKSNHHGMPSQPTDPVIVS
jgi:putative MATE family efflux protein